MRRLTVVLLIAVAACGGGGSSASSTAGSSSAPLDCTDRMINLLNALDVTHIDPGDGIDSGEQNDVQSQIDRLTANDPDIADGGRCQMEFDALPSDQQSSALSRIRPEVVRVLIGVGTNATSKFSAVGSSIN